MSAPSAEAGLAREVEGIAWYQTIDLPGVRTPGIFDTVAAAKRSLLSADLSGKRCLDVATSNGFWAFEMERRGASEVVAIELPDPSEADWPAFDPVSETDFPSATTGFETAHRALASKVERRAISIYDVTAEDLGQFDLVFAGSVLLHLRDPVQALMTLRGVTRGELVLNESVSVPLSILRRRSPSARLIGEGGSNWWVPNVAGLRRMVEAAGFEVLAVGRPYPLRWGEGAPKTWSKTVEGARVRGVVRKVGRSLLGIPHVSLRAKPRG